MASINSSLTHYLVTQIRNIGRRQVEGIWDANIQSVRGDTSGQNREATSPRPMGRVEAHRVVTSVDKEFNGQILQLVLGNSILQKGEEKKTANNTAMDEQGL